jgi:hypothetical protein
VSCWAFSGHSCFFTEPRRKDENERPQTIQRQQISKMASPTTSPARSARSAPGGQPVPRNWLDRPACSSTWFDSGASLWSNRLPPKALRRPDARVQHVNLQFGKQSGMHLQFASAARECLVMKRTTFLAFFLSHGGGRLVHCSSKKRSAWFSYTCWLYRAKKNTLSLAARAALNLRYELAARIAGRFANLAAKAIAPFGKF